MVNFITTSLVYDDIGMYLVSLCGANEVEVAILALSRMRDKVSLILRQKTRCQILVRLFVY